MSFRNQLIYMQFYSVMYMIKLNIELFMIALIMKLTQSCDNSTQNNNDSHVISHFHRQITIILDFRSDDLHDNFKNIHVQTEIHILTKDDNCQKKFKLFSQFND